MADWRTALTVALLLALPGLAAAAPAGKVVIAQGVDPTSLDTMNQQETPASNLARHLYEGLVVRDQNLDIVPALATELPKLVAPTTWEVKLRRGVRFHNGEEFNGESVKWSLERLANPANKLRATPNFTSIDRVEIVDPYTVRVHTKKPWPIFVKAMVFAQAAMYPPKAYEGKDTTYISKNPIGTGPYKYVRWSKDEEIVLEANEHYWRGAPKIKTVVFRPIPDDAVRVAALQNGEIDLAVNIPPHLAAVIDKHARLFLSTAPSVRTIQLMYYTHQMDAQHKVVGPYQGPTADRRVRQAMNLAVGGEEIIKGVLDGKGVRMATMLTDKHFGFDPQLKPVKPDLGQVKKLLAEAGYPNGVDIVLNAPQGRYVRDREVAEAVAGQLTKAGIRTTLRTYEWGNYLNSMVYVHKAGPVWLIGWGAGTYDAESIYVPLFRTGGIFVNYHNPDFDRMVDEAQTIMDEKKRLEQYHRITRLWIEDAAAMPLYQQLDLYGVNKRVVWKARGDEAIRAHDMALKETK
ncbi:MAG TPA: ABC transporter substrate-binding protein [Methylomirabilota bacterium]|jgi:peptide/nickel transport system substrate-binding protein|nr:ABC transporter substrate-binding protein [Methylomirabilota bacterium]